ncbi:hypothetical protein D3C87_126120 [compost metagenome]
MKYIILILLLAGVSHAGVRTVGKGGGYAEMQAILINSQMSLWSEICLSNPEACKLSNEEVSLLTSSLSSPFVLEMNPECAEPTITVLNKNAASIASCALYQDNQAIAKNFSEIATWVLAARLMAIQNMPLKSATDIALKIFQKYEQREQRLAIVLSGSSALVHFLQIQRESAIHNIVSIEGKSSAVDITPLVQEVLTCEGGSLHHWNLNLLSAQELDPTKAFVESEVAWQCTGSSSYRATLQIVFAAPQSEILANSVRIRLVRKTPL